jgi:hypothetical protein
MTTMTMTAAMMMTNDVQSLYDVKLELSDGRHRAFPNMFLILMIGRIQH